MWSPARARMIFGAAALVVIAFVAMRLLRTAGGAADGVTRRDAARFLIEARGEAPATGCTTPFFSDVPCSDAGWGWIEKLRTDKLTHGCNRAMALFCPDTDISRAQLAMMVARSVAGREDAVPLSYGPDPATGRSYSCEPAKPSLHFKDVSPAEIFCQHVHYLWAKGRMADSPDTFAPTRSTTRRELTKFLAAGFGSRGGS